MSNVTVQEALTNAIHMIDVLQTSGLNLTPECDKVKADLEAALAEIEKCEPVPPIEYDADMDRFYIPMIGGWEIQTKGKGSTFRICNTKTHVRWPVLDEHLHEALEQMAKDNRHAYTSPISKEWVGLSDQQIRDIKNNHHNNLVKATEDKLKQLNAPEKG